MSATTLLLSRYAPVDLTSVHSNAGSAVTVLLECQDVLAASCALGSARPHSINDLKDEFKARLQRIEPQYAIQVSAHILQLHLRDLDLAKKRARLLDGGSPSAIETIFLQAQGHSSNGNFDAYLDQYSVQLWNTLTPGNLPDALIRAVLKPVLLYNIDLLATPWVIHTLIAESGSTREPTGFFFFGALALLKKKGKNDRNPYLRDLLFQLSPESLLLDIIKTILEPFGSLVSILVNRVMSNLLNEFGLPATGAWKEKLSVYDEIMRNENQAPSPERQEWLRRQAMNKVPKLLGAPILSQDTFDYPKINKRLIVSALDLLLELLRLE